MTTHTPTLSHRERGSQIRKPMKKLHYEATRIIVENSEGEIALLVRRMVQPHGFKCTLRLIQVPGGAVESGETPLAAAIRELEEETGIVARVGHLTDFEEENGIATIMEMPVTRIYDVFSPTLNIFQRTHIEVKNPDLAPGTFQK